MVICHCKGLSESRLQLLAAQNETVREIVRSCGAGSDCGSCVDTIRALLAERPVSLSPAG